jgi:hypothetical protein
MVLFVLGIPLGQFAVLWKNREFIDERKCTDKASYQQHLRVKRTYGSIFSAYRPDCYYYDILDLTRRLILTGGLIMIGGDEAVAQVLLGIIVSALWLCLVLFKRPYVAFWDNMLSAMLSFVVMITLLSGMALRLYELTKTGADEIQQKAFGVVLVVINAICLVVSLLMTVMSTDTLRRRAGRFCRRKFPDSNKQDQTQSRTTAVVPRDDGEGAAAVESDYIQDI